MQRTDGPTMDDPLLRGYHPIRWIPSSDAPWAGMLTRLPDGESCVLVDVATLSTDWAGWGADPGGHVLTPIEVVRRRDGHDAAMPVCVERVDAFLARRGAASATHASLDDGEAVTLAVSLLRGSAEVARAHRDTPGEWWLTDAGKPVLAMTDTDRTARADDLLHTIGELASVRLEGALRAAEEAVADARVLVRDLGALEAALFQLSEPRPLAIHAYAPLTPRPTADRESVELGEQPPVRWIDSLARHVDADLAALASDTVLRVWRRWVRPRTDRADRPKPGGRRRPWLVAAGIAGGILGIGLLWPTGGGPATADAPDESAAASATPASSASSVEDAGMPATSEDSITDWTTATAQLLTRRTACAGDAACLADVVEDPTRIFPAGVVDAATAERSLVLLDEFGGVAVLRVDSSAGTAASQLAVVVRTDGRLLLRDVHDVAEQKG